MELQRNIQRGLLVVALATIALCAKAQQWTSVELSRQVTHPQPMTGLVLWPDEARDRNATYGGSITLEFSYCLPCKVVTGCKADGTIEYDWSYFENILDDVASRGHQLVARFRYEYPSGTDVDGKKGTTAVPAYIKQRDDYNETYSSNPGGDGPFQKPAGSKNADLFSVLEVYPDFPRN